MMAGDLSRGSSSTSDESGDETREKQLNGKLKLGAKYTSFAQLQRAVLSYCQENKIRLFRSDSRKLKSAHIRVNPVVIERAPECLIYYSLTYSCIFGSKSKNRSKEAMSQMNSSSKGCKFSVRIGLTKDYQSLEVIKMSEPLIHNHLMMGSARKSPPLVSHQSHTSSTPDAFSGTLADLSSFPSNPMHSGIISSKLCEYRSSGLFCDTIIVASDGTVFAHGAILGMFCPRLFTSLNQKPFHSLQSNMVDLSRYSSSLINKLLDFFYLGKLCMEQFNELQDLASHLGVAFNVDGPLPEKEASLNEDPTSTRTSSDCDDHVISDHEGSKDRPCGKACGIKMPDLNPTKSFHQSPIMQFAHVHKMHVC